MDQPSGPCGILENQQSYIGFQRVWDILEVSLEAMVQKIPRLLRLPEAFEGLSRIRFSYSGHTSGQAFGFQERNDIRFTTRKFRIDHGVLTGV